MPSWEPASRTDSSDALRSAARAERLCGAASSRRDRRAAMRANSTATKKALAAINPMVAARMAQGLLMSGNFAWGAVVGTDRDEHRRRHVVFDVADLGVQGLRC